MRLSTSPPTLHRGLLHLALALLLLLAQQLVLRHALEHEADPDHAPHGQCLSCLAGHAVDHATSGTPLASLPGCDAVAAQVANTPLAAPTTTVVAQRARGPPAFLA